jgi:acetyl-CoA carboxylase biotin carboxylase subunit
MFEKVLVANRGEIACRVIRALNELGIQSVAVCSEADVHAKHVRMANEFRLIGPAESQKSYLVVERLIEAARQTGAQAIHPGYGFLSESAVFRNACDEAGITFIGPPAEAMEAMGLKTRAREAMSAAGVPIVPGTVRAMSSASEGLAEAEEIGFPVMLKASAGGGGKGMRLVENADGFEAAFDACTREARAAFGDGAVYLEKAIIKPRHIEIQVLADSHGNVVHLFERECSVQRRHQKVVEEAPAANLSDATRQKMGAVAVAAARAIAYEGAGTVEFLCDANEEFWFLEMNTRLQVEHPVTEMVTGVDLVQEQLRIAAGESLTFSQADMKIRGHAIECRLYAEDPFAGFLPSPGKLTCYRPPSGPGIRVDDGVDEGDQVSSHYDPMLAKIIAWAPSRPAAIARMRAALNELRVGGIRCNTELLKQVLVSPDFANGKYATDLIASSLTPLAPEGQDEARNALFAAVAALTHQRNQRQARPPEGSSRASGWAIDARERAVRRSDRWSG